MMLAGQHHEHEDAPPARRLGGRSRSIDLKVQAGGECDIPLPYSRDDANEPTPTAPIELLRLHRDVHRSGS